MKFIIVGLTALMLSSCAMSQSSTEVVVTKPEVVIPPSSMLRCGSVKLPKNFRNDKDVADSYIRLWKHNQFCHNNMNAVKDYLDNAQQDIK